MKRMRERPHHSRAGSTGQDAEGLIPETELWNALVMPDM